MVYRHQTKNGGLVSLNKSARYIEATNMKTPPKRAVRSLILTLSFALNAAVSGLAQSFDLPDHKARLGELHYSARVGSADITEGEPFRVMLASEQTTLMSIQVAVVGGVVHALRFVYVDSLAQPHTITVGDDDDSWQPPFFVPSGRKLVGISGAGGWWIDRIAFYLDDGSVSPTYGGSGGDTEFQLKIAQSNGSWKGHFMGFWGTVGEHVESIGLVFWPVE